MTYIPQAYFITRSEADHIRNTLDDAMMFYEMYTSKPSDIEDTVMQYRLDDCQEAQDIIRNLESDEMLPLIQEYTADKRKSNVPMAQAIDQVVDQRIWSDTDYFD